MSELSNHVNLKSKRRVKTVCQTPLMKKETKQQQRLCQKSNPSMPKCVSKRNIQKECCSRETKKIKQSSQTPKLVLIHQNHPKESVFPKSTIKLFSLKYQILLRSPRLPDGASQTSPIESPSCAVSVSAASLLKTFQSGLSLTVDRRTVRLSGGGRKSECCRCEKKGFYSSPPSSSTSSSSSSSTSSFGCFPFWRFGRCGR